MKANKKNSSEYQKTTDGLVFLLIACSRGSTKNNSATLRSALSVGTPGHCPDLSYDSYATGQLCLHVLWWRIDRVCVGLCKWLSVCVNYYYLALFEINAFAENMA